MPFADFKWEYGKFGDDDIRTTTICGLKVDICQKSRGAPGVKLGGMGVDRPNTYFRIEGSPWMASRARSMVETVDSLEVLIGFASEIAYLSKPNDEEIVQELNLERNKMERKEWFV